MSTDKKPVSVLLHHKNGRVSQSMPGFLKEFVEKEGVPELVWIEPRPLLPADGGAAGRLEGFQGLQRWLSSDEDDLETTLKKLLKKITPEEVCLYWPEKMLHAACGEEGTIRCFFCREQAGEDTEEMKKHEEEVQLRAKKDIDRFGITKPDFEKVKTVTYWRGAALFAWRISGISHS
ncbi:MAG: hypothetical protein GY862_15065 [Gammaproteobacteria bacterium]|nr:hypothetical protein [Gammaproteobacteria bacterium]